VKTQTGAPLVPSAQASAAAAMHAPAHLDRKWTALFLGAPPSASVWIPRPARRGAVDVSRSARPTVFAAAARPRPCRAGLATTHRCSRAHFRNDELGCYLLTSTSSLACAQRAPRKTLCRSAVIQGPPVPGSLPRADWQMSLPSRPGTGGDPAGGAGGCLVGTLALWRAGGTDEREGGVVMSRSIRSVTNKTV